MSVTHEIRPKNTTRAWRHQAPRAQKGHVLLLLGHLVVPAAKLRTLSLPNKTTDCLHRLQYATWALAWRIFALCCAKHCTEVCVSLDHLPPTSPAITTILALPPVPHSSGCLSSFRLRACLRATLRRHQCRVQSQLHSSKERQTSAITSNLRDVQISHHDVGGHPGPAFATDLGDSTLHGITSPAEHPHLAACCSVTSRERPHEQKRLERGSGKRRRRSSNILNDCDSIRMTLSISHFLPTMVGFVRFTILVPGSYLLQAPPNLGSWHPRLKTVPESATEPRHKGRPGGPAGNFGVLGSDHLQTVCPTHPMCGVACPLRVAQPQTPQCQGHGGGLVVARMQRLCLEHFAETLEDLLIVSFSKLEGGFRNHCPQEEIRSGGCAIQQQQPARLGPVGSSRTDGRAPTLSGSRSFERSQGVPLVPPTL